MTKPIGNAEFRAAKKYWESISGISASGLAESDEIRFASKYSIILCAEASIQMGKFILEADHLHVPQKSPEIFFILAQKNILTEEHARRLSRLARFRNQLIHDYSGTDLKRLSIVLRNDLFDVQKFQEIALRWERSYNGRGIISQLIEGAGVKTVLKSVFRRS